jgi:transposase
MSDAQRETLESLAKSQTAAHREVTRAKALLLAADGLASTAVAYEVGVSPSSVVAWRSRFAEEGLAKLGRVRPGRGRKPQIPAEKKAIRRGVFKSVPDLIAAIEAYLQADNDPKPFVWTATAEEILEKVSRGRVALASIPANNETPH